MFSYKKLFEQCDHPFAIINGQGGIIELNKSFRTLFPGKEKPNLKGYLPPDFHIAFETALKKAGENIPSRFEIIDNFHIHTEPSCLVELFPFEENPVVILAVITDITETKRRENSLIMASSGWRLIIDSITDAICLTDPDGQVIRLNSMFANVVKAGFLDVLGKSLFSYFPGLSGPHEQMKSGAVKGRYRGEFEWSGFIFRIIAYPYRSETDRISGIIYIFQDITDEKKAERALKEAEVRLSEIMTQ